MTLAEKILAIYPELTGDDLDIFKGTILLENHLDGNGDVITKWEHPTLAEPTQEQLDGVTE